jgi:hypothetical protein
MGWIIVTLKRKSNNSGVMPEVRRMLRAISTVCRDEGGETV